MRSILAVGCIAMHGNAHRDDSDIFAQSGIALFFRRFPRPRAASLQHVKRDEKQEQTPSQLECGQRNTKSAEQIFAHGGE